MTEYEVTKDQLHAAKKLMQISRKLQQQSLKQQRGDVAKPLDEDVVPGLNEFFNYNAIVVAVYDGDTITVDMDLGLDVWLHNANIRLNRINTPEVKGVTRDAGLKSRDWLRDRILGKSVIIKTIEDTTEKYGRYLGEVWLEGKNINDALVLNGLAQYVTY